MLSIVIANTYRSSIRFSCIYFWIAHNTDSICGQIHTIVRVCARIISKRRICNNRTIINLNSSSSSRTKSSMNTLNSCVLQNHGTLAINGVGILIFKWANSVWRWRFSKIGTTINQNRTAIPDDTGTTNDISIIYRSTSFDYNNTLFYIAYGSGNLKLSCLAGFTDGQLSAFRNEEHTTICGDSTITFYCQFGAVLNEETESTTIIVVRLLLFLGFICTLQRKSNTVIDGKLFCTCYKEVNTFFT